MREWFERRLVEGWQCAYQWGSVQLHVIGTAFVSLLLMVPAMPAELQELLPPGPRAVLIALWFVAGLYIRLRKQGAPK